MRPVGILGGTFDPIHFGHLRLAEELAQQLDLAEVRFIPSGRPWHRDAPGATPEQRLEMVRLAIAGNPRFHLDGREASSGAPGYTVETLAKLRQELGAAQPLCLLLGADAFLGLATWHHWRELFKLAHIAVAQRPGFPLQAAQMGDELRAEAESRMSSDPRDLQATPCGKVLACPIPPLDISATSIRSAVKAGKSPRYLLPDAVVDYIQTHHLYR
ncbi:putative nicotinate-nucleotide adenylyltransferase [Sulfurimicrobium lacus]|uniref:Probable nicotinate-nucleotide adenylyltransferase n=1 Tax=Sulfurimicrobium lacus TaxID=2715678 RepID=A0A6F8V5N8_9PROT|nr:putative nicotinate-nucleotide adenylyltransferase [Sulfurimicrobium lacus]